MSGKIPFALNQEESTIQWESIYIQHSMCIISIVSFNKLFIGKIVAIKWTTNDSLSTRSQLWGRIHSLFNLADGACRLS